MKLTLQVTSLELSQKLQALGVKHEPLFYWVLDGRGNKAQVCWKGAVGKIHSRYVSFVPAFTVAELGEMLPWEIEARLLHSAKSSDGGWIVFYEKNNLGFPMNQKVRIDDQGADTEADARAKLLIYLLENSLMPESLTEKGTEV